MRQIRCAGAGTSERERERETEREGERQRQRETETETDMRQQEGCPHCGMLAKNLLEGRMVSTTSI